MFDRNSQFSLMTESQLELRETIQPSEVVRAVITSTSRKNQNVSISSDSVYDSVAYDPVKTRSRSQKQKRKNKPIKRPGIDHCHWFILPLLLATPTMQFSLDHKRRSHKQNQCFVSDSVGLIFTRSYHSTLLITTLTTTPLLVKTSL